MPVKEQCLNILDEMFKNGLCECDLTGISIGLLNEWLEKHGYEMCSNGIEEPGTIDTNGWQIDFWSVIYKKDSTVPVFNISGSVLETDLRITKCD